MDVISIIVGCIVTLLTVVMVNKSKFITQKLTDYLSLENALNSQSTSRIAHGKQCSGLKYGGPQLFAGSMSNPKVQAPKGQVFIGISLSRNHKEGHPDSVTRQEVYDFNEIIDREYKYFASTNDDGWLVGGGESELSFKIPAVDSSHITIMEIGTFEKNLGGISKEEIINILESGKILIPQIRVIPIRVELNPDSPPEVEVNFHHQYNMDNNFENQWNWQLKFVQNQLFQHLKFPTQHGDNHYHLSVTRKAEFRSENKYKEWSKNCDKVIKKWQKLGPQEMGIYLFRDRNRPIYHIKPNFFPPYTSEKRKIIQDILKNTLAAECGFD